MCWGNVFKQTKFDLYAKAAIISMSDIADYFVELLNLVINDSGNLWIGRKIALLKISSNEHFAWFDFVKMKGYYEWS